MEKPDRQQQIRAHLGIEPISHGQIHTFQIAVPESQKRDIPLERYQVLADSLTNHKTNLLPLIVRRTEAYSEEEEYEVVYGADWCIVAKEIDIEKLWVWFFDMNDEQAAAAQAEMEQLENVMPPDSGPTNIESLLDNKLRFITAKIEQFLVNKPVGNESNLQEKFSAVDSKIEKLQSTVDQLADLVKEIIDRLPPKQPKQHKAPKLNLRRNLTQEEIADALDQVNATSAQKNAAWQAIQYWKKPGKYLTWDNLKKSIKGSDSVDGFGPATYDKLKEIADIADEDVT